MADEYTREEFENEEGSYVRREALTEEPRGPQFDDATPPQGNAPNRAPRAERRDWTNEAKEFISKQRTTLIPFFALVLAVAIGFAAIVALGPDEEAIKVAPQNNQEEIQNQGNASTAQENVGVAKESADTSPTAQGQETVEPSGQRVEGGIRMSANPGDGITHLARRAIAQQLSESNQTLSPEQLVYAEDFLQNCTGTQQLEIGEVIVFSSSDMQQAISGAQNLADWQIQSLHRYTT